MKTKEFTPDWNTTSITLKVTGQNLEFEEAVIVRASIDTRGQLHTDVKGGPTTCRHHQSYYGNRLVDVDTKHALDEDHRQCLLTTAQQFEAAGAYETAKIEAVKNLKEMAKIIEDKAAILEGMSYEQFMSRGNDHIRPEAGDTDEDVPY